MLFLALLHFLFFLGSKDTQALIKSEIQRVTRPSLRAYVSLFIGPLVKEKKPETKGPRKKLKVFRNNHQ